MDVVILVFSLDRYKDNLIVFWGNIKRSSIYKITIYNMRKKMAITTAKTVSQYQNANSEERKVSSKVPLSVCQSVKNSIGETWISLLLIKINSWIFVVVNMIFTTERQVYNSSGPLVCQSFYKRHVYRKTYFQKKRFYGSYLVYMFEY